MFLGAFTPSVTCTGWFSALCPITSVSSWAVCVWGPWLAFSVVSEIQRKDRYLPGPPRALPILIGALFLLVGWWLAVSPMARDIGAFYPSLREPALIGATKKGLLISLMSAGTGIWLLFANNEFFHTRTKQ